MDKFKITITADDIEGAIGLLKFTLNTLERDGSLVGGPGVHVMNLRHIRNHAEFDAEKTQVINNLKKEE